MMYTCIISRKYYLLRYGLDFVTTATITERDPYLTYYGVLTLYEDPA